MLVYLLNCSYCTIREIGFWTSHASGGSYLGDQWHSMESHFSRYRINLNKRTVCYVVGVAPSGKVWVFFLFSPPFFGVFFASFPRQGILDYIAHRSLIQVNTVMKRVAAMLGAKERDLNATDWGILNNRISYPLRSHNDVGCATHPREYIS